MPLEIDIIGDVDDVDGGNEEEEVLIGDDEEDWSGSWDQSRGYMVRDPRKPSFPAGSGGSPNYGLRVGEEPVPEHERSPIMPMYSRGKQSKFTPAETEEMRLGELGFFDHNGIGDEALFLNKKDPVTFKMVKPAKVMRRTRRQRPAQDFVRNTTPMVGHIGASSVPSTFDGFGASSVPSTFDGFGSMWTVGADAQKPATLVPGASPVAVASAKKARIAKRNIARARAKGFKPMVIRREVFIGAILADDPDLKLTKNGKFFYRDYPSIDALMDDYMNTFFTPNVDKKTLGSIDGMWTVGGLNGMWTVGEIGAFGIAKGGIKLPKLPDVGKAVGGAIKVAAKSAGEAGKIIAKAGTAIISAANESYKKLSAAMDVNKGSRNKLIASMNQTKGMISAIEAKQLKSPKAQAKLKALKEKYDKLAAEAKKHSIKVDELDKKQTDIKASGVAMAVSIGAKATAAAKNPSSASAPGTAQTKLSDLGIEPVTAAIAIGAIAAAVAVGLMLSKAIENSGKLQVETKETAKTIDIDENEFKKSQTTGSTSTTSVQPVKVAYNPATDPPTAQIPWTDPETGKQIMVTRVNDTVMIPTSTETSTEATAEEGRTYSENVQETSKESKTKQEGAAESAAGKTGIPAVTAAEAAKEQGTLLGKIGLSPWIIAAIGVGAVVVVYFAATSGKKKEAPK